MVLDALGEKEVMLNVIWHVLRKHGYVTLLGGSL